MASVRPVVLLAAAMAWLPAAGMAGGETLTWNDCLREARALNPVLRAARLRVDAVRARLASARSPLFPRVDASLGADRSGGTPLFHGLEQRSNASLSVSQSLFSGFGTIAEIRRVQAAGRRDEAQLQATGADVRLSLRNAFISVLYGQASIALREAVAARRKENTGIVRARVAAGKDDPSAAQQAEAEEGAADFEVARARRALLRDQKGLCREIGRARVEPVTVAASWDASPPPAAPDMETIAETTPAVWQAGAALEEAAAGIQAARADFWPSVDAVASIAQDGSAWPPSESRGWTAGVALSLNIFAGGRDHAALRIAAIEREIAEAELAIARRGALEALEEALEPYANSFDALEVRRKSLDAARSRADAARTEYGDGKTDFNAWHQIEGELAQAQTDELDARREFLQAEAAWLKSTGQGPQQ